MNKRPIRVLDRSISSIPLAQLASFLLIAAAMVWLTACNVALNPGGGGSPSGASAPYASSQSGTGTTNQPQGTSSSAGAEPRDGSSAAAADNGQVRPKPLTAQDQGQGGITMKATWVVTGSPEASSIKLDRELGFVVAMDTHSGDLGQYDLAKGSVLRDDKGKELQPLAWQSTSNDSHHRAGILTFQRGLEQGSKYLELIVSNVGGAKERVLKWDLPQ